MRQLRQNIFFQIAMFLALYAGFYWGNKLYTGLTVPGGLYSSFLHDHLNYVVWFRNFLLESASVWLGWLGYETFVTEYHLRFVDGGGVQLVYACMGFAIFSFWWAMILAFPQTVKNKLVYLFGGTAIIVVLNIIRIGAVAAVFHSEWGRAHREIDHHLIFNILAYGILFFMLYRWFNLREEKETTKTLRRTLRDNKENHENHGGTDYTEDHGVLPSSDLRQRKGTEV